MRRKFSPLRVCLVLPILFGALASAGLLAAQEPPKKNTTQETGFVLRQTVRRVRVDVVVTDGQGRPLPGLQASDFQIAEDGKPQSIRQFEWHGKEDAQAALPKRPALPPHTFMNLPEAPERGPLTVLLYDILNTPLEDQPYAHEQMLAFLNKNPGQRIAIFVLGDSLRLVQGFTSDTEQLEGAAKSAATAQQRSTLMTAPPSQAEALSDMAAQQMASAPSPMASSGAGATSGPAAALQRMADREANAEAQYASYRLDMRVNMTLEALAQLGRFLAGPEGRKNLIWFSGSFPAGVLPDPAKSPVTSGSTVVRDDAVRNYSESMKKASDLLNAAQVAVYPVDARGLQTNAAFLASDPGRAGRNSQETLKSNIRYLQTQATEHGTMDFLGEQTGGRAFYNTNGLEQGPGNGCGRRQRLLLAGLCAEQYEVRWIGAPHRGASRARALPSGLSQKLLRRQPCSGGADSGAANGDSTPQDKAPASAASMTADSQFGAPPSHQLIFAAHLDAVGNPTPATAEQIAALVPYREREAKTEHKKLVEPAAPVAMQQYVIQYGLLASQLEFRKSANGAYDSDVSIAAAAFNQDGAPLCGAATRLKDDIPAAKMGDIRKDGYRAAQAFAVPVDTAVIRLMVRDEYSGQNGSMEIHLPLTPDKQLAARAQ